MNKSTKILAGVASALVVGGVGGTATYLGVQNADLKKEHNDYVQESTLRDEESKQKINDLEEANNFLQEENQSLKDDIKYFNDNL